MSIDREVAALFRAHGVTLADDDSWRVQSATVIRHKALERLAAAANVAWDMPTVVRATEDEAVLLIAGRIGDRLEWSVGEAKIGANYRVSGKQAAYLWSMAEKRGKDRVILKLVGLHGFYSEEEADAFKHGGGADEPDSRELYMEQARKTIAATSGPDLAKWWTDERQNRRDFGLSQDDVDELKALIAAKVPKEAA